MFRRDEFYGYDIKKKLELHKVEIELSRLYRVLNEMEKDGLLKSRWKISSIGPRKKMYTIGEKGKKELRKILLNAIETVHDFYGDYLMGLYPEIKVFDEIFDWLTQDIKGNERIAYLVSNNSPLNEIVFRSLSHRLPQVKTHIIISNNATRSLNVESKIMMKGEYNDIPYKNGFFDMIYAIGLPPSSIMEDSLSELSRVLNEKGSLRFVTPSVLLQELEDPYTIGDFIEKHEHEIIEQGESLDKKTLMNILKKKFGEIKEKELVHITLLAASLPSKSRVRVHM
jgi:DNA-binding PadR family transcriptional regulator